MKAMHIDFVGHRSWLWVWSVASLIAVSMVGAIAWRGWWDKNALEETRQRIAVVEARLDQSRTPQVQAVDPKYASAVRAAKILQFDLNKLFAAVEGLDQPQVQLQNLNLDSGSATLRLEYELPAMANVFAVTAMLNAGRDSGPWRLESANMVSKGALMGAMTSEIVRGIWSVEIDRL